MDQKSINSILHRYGIFHIAAFAVAFWSIDRMICTAVLHDTPPQLSNVLSTLLHIVFFIAWCFSCFLFFFSRYYAEKTGGRNCFKDNLKYERSIFDLLHFFSDANPYYLDPSTLPVEDWRTAEGIILGKIGNRLIKRPSNGVGNLMVFSLPGGGKTTSQIIPSALRFSGSVLAIDIKGDILHYTRNHRNIKIFAPDDPENSVHYNPLFGIESLSEIERRNYIEQISYIVLPDSQDKDGKYFVEGGRDYFNGVAMYMLDQNIETTFPEIAQAIVNDNAFDWAKRIASSSCEIAKSYVCSYIGSNEKNVAGAYSTIVKAIRPFAFGSLATLLDGAADSITQETLEQGADIYIEIPQDKIKLYAPITTILVQQFLTMFMRRPDRSTGQVTRPILFLLDEFPQLQFDYEILNAALSTLRSKGVSLFLAMQSISQLVQKYGESGFRSIVDNCSYISVMSAQDPESREYFSKLCGTRKILKVGTSSGVNSSSRNTQEERTPIFQPADFGNLGDDLIIIANGKSIRAQKTYCFK